VSHISADLATVAIRKAMSAALGIEPAAAASRRFRKLSSLSGLRHRWQTVPDTRATLFAIWREALTPWQECSVMDGRRRDAERSTDTSPLVVRF